MADLNQPSIIEDTPEDPRKVAQEERAPLVENDAPPVEESASVPEQYVPLLPGESLEDFAARYNTSAEKVVKRNNLNPDYIFPNQWVWV